MSDTPTPRCPPWCTKDHARDVAAGRGMSVVHQTAVGIVPVVGDHHPLAWIDVRVVWCEDRGNPEVSVLYARHLQSLFLSPEQAVALAGIQQALGLGELAEFLRQAAALLSPTGRA